MATRQLRINIIEGAVKMMNERARSYSKEELEKGRNPEESIVIQSNRLYVLLLNEWLQAERELLNLESEPSKTIQRNREHSIETRVPRQRKKKDY